MNDKRAFAAQFKQCLGDGAQPFFAGNAQHLTARVRGIGDAMPAGRNSPIANL